MFYERSVLVQADGVTETSHGVHLGNVNEDEKVNIKDATAIQKYVVGISTSFMIGEVFVY